MATPAARGAGRLSALRGSADLAHVLVDRIARLVAEEQDRVGDAVVDTVARVPGLGPAAASVEGLRRAVSALSIGSVRVTNRVVQALLHTLFDVAERVLPADGDADVRNAPIPLRSDVTTTARWAGDALLGALNGLVGDHLAETGNPLAIAFGIRTETAFLTADPDALRDSVPEASDALVVFVHGLSATEWSWSFGAGEWHGDPSVNLGTVLRRDAGLTPLWVRYNSGLPVAVNAAALDDALDAFVRAWPVPVRRVVLVGHSMGGLVVRSAAHRAQESGRAWPSLVSHVVCLGSPHHGAPLEKLVNVLVHVLEAIDVPGTRIPAKILRVRSAGVRDLRFGTLRDEEWQLDDPDTIAHPGGPAIPLLPGAAHVFIGATLTRDPAHPLGRLVGDVMVRLPSARAEALQRHGFAIDARTVSGLAHHQLQDHPAVIREVRHALGIPD